MKKFLALAVAMATLAGCAQSYQPVVDARGHDSARYQQDLFECRQYAEQVSPAGKAAVSGLGGAAAGAALGAITGALVGGVGAGEAAAVGAATGGAVGVGAGAYSGVNDQQQIIDNCLRGRGYNVLN
jgi:hypothetical protein